MLHLLIRTLLLSLLIYALLVFIPASPLTFYNNLIITLVVASIYFLIEYFIDLLGIPSACDVLCGEPLVIESTNLDPDTVDEYVKDAIYQLKLEEKSSEPVQPALSAQTQTPSVPSVMTSVPVMASTPVMTSMPSVPSTPTMTSMPSVPSTPTMTSMPSTPTMTSMPSTPTMTSPSPAPAIGTNKPLGAPCNFGFECESKTCHNNLCFSETKPQSAGYEGYENYSFLN